MSLSLSAPPSLLSAQESAASTATGRRDFESSSSATTGTAPTKRSDLPPLAPGKRGPYNKSHPPAIPLEKVILTDKQLERAERKKERKRLYYHAHAAKTQAERVALSSSSGGGGGGGGGGGAGGGGAAVSTSSPSGGGGPGGSGKRKRVEILTPLEAEETAMGAGEEDGNVEYCTKCDAEGELVCCDRCPRSYHAGCAGLSDVPDEGLWFCEMCVRVFGENKEWESNNSGTVCCAYFDGPYLVPAAAGGAKNLSMRDELRSICTALAEHEFGEIFRDPVDSAAVGGYSDIITRPMDYGTVALRLCDESYGKEPAFDLVRAISDLRLVPYNAKLFNKPGSTIWRFADELFRETETLLRARIRMSAQMANRLKVVRLEETPTMIPWMKNL